MFTALCARISEAGGEILTRAPVSRVEIADGRAIGVWVKGERQAARVVILAVPPQQLANLLPPDLRGLNLPGWAALQPAAGVSLDLGVEGLVTDRAAVDVPEEQIVLACHSLWDPSMAPPGHHLIQGLRFLTPAQARDPLAVEEAKQRLLAAAERFYPGATQRVALRRFLVRPMLTSVWHRADQSEAGSLVPVQVPAIPNLFFVGDGTDAPGELSTVACNAALTAAAAAGRWLAAHPH